MNNKIIYNNLLEKQHEYLKLIKEKGFYDVDPLGNKHFNNNLSNEELIDLENIKKQSEAILEEIKKTQEVTCEEILKGFGVNEM